MIEWKCAFSNKTLFCMKNICEGEFNNNGIEVFHEVIIECELIKFKFVGLAIYEAEIEIIAEKAHRGIPHIFTVL